MTASDGLAPSQYRAIGITLGAIYALYAARGVVSEWQFRPAIDWESSLVSALAWVPGVAALVFFVAGSVLWGRRALLVAAISFPLAIVLWPLVGNSNDSARLDFWIHAMPGHAAVAALLTLPRILAWLALLLDCTLVELVLQQVGLVRTWETSLVRLAFTVTVASFFFILVLLTLRQINRSNQAMLRSARDQTEAAMMQARDKEIARLDRLTHDFVLSLLSAAAEGVPTDKLRVQAETARRQLGEARPDEGEVGTVEEMVSRIAARCERYEVPVVASGEWRAEECLPRQAAVEIEAAVEEAVRNTVRHSDGGSRVTITGDRNPSRPAVTIRICDDGPGFDPASVNARLGVSHSILQRIETLPGGRVAIDSAPGQGTVVTIVWSPS